MIITPQELQQWMDNGKSFTVVDIRPEEHRNEFPLTGLNPSISDANSILETEDDTVLVCQFGIVTEGIIVEKNLEKHFTFTCIIIRSFGLYGSGRHTPAVFQPDLVQFLQ